MSDAVVAGLISGTVAALVASAVAVLVLNTERTDQRILSAFDLLTGGTQKRSAGIALIERDPPKGSWRGVAVKLLTNQAIYLLEESEEGDRRVEIRNLQRILCLLHALTGDESAFLSRPTRLRRALRRKPARQTLAKSEHALVYDRERNAVTSSLEWRKDGGRRFKKKESKKESKEESEKIPLGLEIDTDGLVELTEMFKGDRGCDHELSRLWAVAKSVQG